jgi:hypothetical protein
VVALGRDLPLPGASRLTWMLASVEASRGNADRALSVLERGRHAEEPWSLYLRALLQERRAASRDLVERALRADPGLVPAQQLLRELGAAGVPR